MRVKGCCGGVPRCVRIVLHCGIDCTESKPETTEHYALVRWLWYCNNSHDSTIFTTHKAASIAPLVIVSSNRRGLVKDPFVCSRVIFHFVPKCFQITHTVDLRRAASCLKAKWITRTGKRGNTFLVSTITQVYTRKSVIDTTNAQTTNDTLHALSVVNANRHAR